jgi:lycopene cyclase domain-containing protein
MDRLQYLALLGGCLLVTLPLEFLLGARVYRRPRRLLATLAVPLALFFVWDAIAIARDTWSFTSDYVTGWRAPLNVPVEEVAFFVVIPICALLTYEVVSRLLKTTHG